jgi:hypothetical protein
MQYSFSNYLTFIAALLVSGASLVGDSLVHQVQAQPARAELQVVVTRQLSEGLSERDFTPELAQAIKEHAISRITTKLQALARESGASSTRPNIQSESTVIEAQGKKLVVIRYQINSVSRGLEILGISGTTLNRVLCARDSLEEILITSGPCATKIKEIHGVTIGR